jgi:signal transduction histidine kinase
MACARRARYHVPMGRLLTVLGYALLAVVAVPEALSWRERSAHGGLWIAALVAFALAYTVAAFAPEAARRRRVLTVAVQTAAMVAMSVTAPCLYAELLLVIVAWQVAALVRPAPAVAWIVGQTAVLGVFVMQGCGVSDAVFALLAMLGCQAFALIAVSVAARERAARRALAGANAELRATRTLLAEASRGHERARLARELHDVMGHDLTALGLQLEVARNLTSGQALLHVARARALCDHLVEEIRGVVSATRAASGTDVGPVLSELVADTPGLSVHLTRPEPLVLDDPARAHCLVRCLQEIVTNALRHAHAKNLWLTITRTDDAITVLARDDGPGAEAVREGHGLAGMRERLQELGGALRVEPAPFALSAWLPARAEAT